MHTLPLSAPRPGISRWGEFDENGINLDDIRENLRLTPVERLRKADEKRLNMLRAMRWLGELPHAWAAPL
jgi:hypothetical protein